MSAPAALRSYLATGVRSGALIVMGAVIGDRICFRMIVVPRLPDVSSVPLWWWAAVLSPLAAAVALSGYLCPRLNRVWSAAIAGTLALLGYEFVAAHLNWPGHYKSYAIEAPAFFWSTIAALWFLIVLAATMAGYAVRWSVCRARARAPAE